MVSRKMQLLADNQILLQLKTNITRAATCRQHNRHHPSDPTLLIVTHEQSSGLGSVDSAIPHSYRSLQREKSSRQKHVSVIIRCSPFVRRPVHTPEVKFMHNSIQKIQKRILLRIARLTRPKKKKWLHSAKILVTGIHRLLAINSWQSTYPVQNH